MAARNNLHLVRQLLVMEVNGQNLAKHAALDDAAVAQAARDSVRDGEIADKASFLAALAVAELELSTIALDFLSFRSDCAPIAGHSVAWTNTTA